MTCICTLSDVHVHTLSDVHVHTLSDIHVYNIPDVHMCTIPDVHMCTIPEVLCTDVLYLKLRVVILTCAVVHLSLTDQDTITADCVMGVR